ncbi:oxidoreductase [Spirochaetia bacterium]|nr:oxidoreductase [Spirochaetia bacterium]
MKINFILNGDDCELNTEPERRLIDVLRREYSLLGAKAGCLCGRCGVCSIIFNGTITAACLIPAFRARGSEIITIEGFSLQDEYQDIVSGFTKTGVSHCGYCDTGKILAVEALLKVNPQPTRAEALVAFSGVNCRCTEPDLLADAVLAIADTRQRKNYGR